MTFNLLGNHSVTVKEGQRFSPGQYSITYEKQLYTLKKGSKAANLGAFLKNEIEREAIFCEMKMLEWIGSPPALKGKRQGWVQIKKLKKMYAPLYRQGQEWNRAGMQLSRQTMSNWVLRVAEDWLKPVYEELHGGLIQRQVLHADETTLQVLKLEGRTARSKCYMWLYRTSGDAEHTIVLYEYRPTRKAENAAAFLEGFSGWLHADGYAGYHRLSENIRVVGCWAHLRRKFDEAVNALPKEQRAGCAALEGLEYCNALFGIEQELAGLPPEGRYEQRLTRSKPVMDALLAWAETKSAAAPKSALGRSLYYLREQWPYLIRYLEDGRLEISNNRAERNVKPSVMGRKNWLFANTEGGAQSNAMIYSLIETAKENGLDPYRYLVYVLTEAPRLAAEGG